MLSYMRSLLFSRGVAPSRPLSEEDSTIEPVRPPSPSATALAKAKEEFDEANRQLAANDLAAAARHLRASLSLHQDFAEAQCNLGSLLKDLGDLVGAERHLQLSLKLKPELSPAMFNLAMIHIDARRWVDAAELLRRTLALDEWQADAQYWLANAETVLGNMDAAQRAYGAAIRISPQYVQARWGSVMAKVPVIPKNILEQTSAPKIFELELRKLNRWFDAQKPSRGYLAVGATQPFQLAYIEGNHRAVLSEYGNLCASLMNNWKNQGLASPEVTLPKKRHRIGIVSAHIYSHSVWHALTKGWIQNLDPNTFELHLFQTSIVRDDETEWAAVRVAAHHQSASPWTDWAQLISDNAVDVLIYPEIGMDSTTTRLASLRLAPVQLASWGHPITTGLPTIDCFVSSEAMEPTNSQDHYRERLIKLPRLGSCYEPRNTTSQRPDLAQWGISTEDRILLCAGQPFKYRPEHDHVWASLAAQCEPCKLVFFEASCSELSERFEERLRKAFSTAQVDFDKNVRFIPWQSQASFFGWLDVAAVYLDTIGFSGFNTAMQAVERNTPVVAYEGSFLRGRFASAILQRLGLSEMVAHNMEEFIQIASRAVHEDELRHVIQNRIAEHKHLLYRDEEAASELGRHLLALCE